MLHIFTNAEYADMLYVYVFCNGSATTAVEDCCRRFHMQRIPDRRVFSKVFNILHERAHVSSERARQQYMGNGKIFFEKAERSPATSPRKLSTRLCVSRTRVWRTLHGDGLYTFYPERVQNLHPGDCHVSRIMSLVTY
jgi:hypothetical protein